MKPKILTVFLSYKRPQVLQECLRSYFENTKIRPDLCYILDDNSGPELQNSLVNFAAQYSTQLCPINLLLNKQNMGVGSQLETSFSLARQINPEIFSLVEGDYYFRNQHLEDVISIFENDPYTVAVPGCDHYDMRLPSKYYGEFAKLMEGYYGSDIKSRYNYYRPFKIGNIEVFGATNSCGSQHVYYQRLMKYIKENNRTHEFFDNLYSSFSENGNRMTASDGKISCSITWEYNLWAERNGIDLTKHFAYTNILPSIAFHAANGGINSPRNLTSFPLGGSFDGVNSGTFPKDYNNWKRL